MVAEQQQPAFGALRQPDSDDGGHPLRSNQFSLASDCSWPKAAAACCPDICRSPRYESGFCQFCLSFQGSGLTATRGKLCRQSPHSRSIVSGTCKHLKDRDLVSERANFTVRLTVTIFRLGPTDSDRCRNRIYVHRYFRTTQLGVRSAPAHCSRAQAGSTAIPDPFAAWRMRSSRLSSLRPTTAERATRSDAR
jgi:hypothetical protein